VPEPLGRLSLALALVDDDRVAAAAHALDVALLPFDEVVAAVAPPRRALRDPLCQLLLASQDAAATLDLGPDLPTTKLPVDQPVSGFDLVVETSPCATGPSATFDLATTDATITTRLAHCWTTALTR
jgi:hypothetical protein